MEIFEKILHSKKLSYERLIPLLNEYMNQSGKINNNITTVNVYIDFFDVIKQLYNPKTIESFSNIKHADRFMITSEIINIVGHYRHFFYSRMHMYTNIYFYYNSKESTYHKAIEPEYKSDFYSKRISVSKGSSLYVMDNVIKNNVKLIKTFLEYVPHAYFIDTEHLESFSLPYYLIEKYSKDDEFNVIISNDKIQYQNLIYNDKTIVLELRGERSKIVSIENLNEILLSDSKKSASDFSILPDMITLVQALSGNKNYGIKSVKNLGVARSFAFIQKCIDNGILSNMEYLDIEELKNSLDGTLKPEELEHLERNFKLLNSKIITTMNFYDPIIEKQIIDRIDAKSVRYINENYFLRYPILVDYVFEGEAYE